METGYPGFAGLGLPRDAEAAAEMDEPYIYHFPDGNASLARLDGPLADPGVAPGASMEDIVTARFDYGELDEPRVRRRGCASRAPRCTCANRDGGVDIGYVAATARTGSAPSAACSPAIT